MSSGKGLLTIKIKKHQSDKNEIKNVNKKNVFVKYLYF